MVKRTCNHVFKFNVLVTSYEIIAADVKELAEVRRLYWPLGIGALALGPWRRSLAARQDDTALWCGARRIHPRKQAALVTACNVRTRMRTHT